MIFPSSDGATAVGTAVCTLCAPGRASTFVNRNELESSNSRFGIRGHEKLGPGLKAIFQLETRFLLDQNTTTFADRDSFVGLASGWGTVKLGRNGHAVQGIRRRRLVPGRFQRQHHLHQQRLSPPWAFGGQNRAARFHERAVNVAQYESPQLGPFEFKSQYSAGENDTASPPRKPHWWSHGGKLEFGNFEILMGYEAHGISSACRQLAHGDAQQRRSERALQGRGLRGRVQVQVGQPPVRDRRQQQALEGNGATVTGRVQEYKNTAYMFLYEGRLSPQWRVAFHYVKAKQGSCSRVNAVCNTDGLDGSQTSLGVAYHFSRRTYLFLMGAYIKNGILGELQQRDAEHRGGRGRPADRGGHPHRLLRPRVEAPANGCRGV
jgi:predicted porin